MAETEKVVSENTVADAPKKNAVASEPTPLKNDAEDLGAAVVKPTDENPKANKSTKEVSGQAPQKNAGKADAMPSLKGESKETDSDGKKISEGDMPDGLKKFLDKKDEKKESKEAEKVSKDDEVKSENKEEDQKAKDVDVKEHIDALTSGEKDLSEEFKAKAATIFEAAIKSKVREIEESMEADYNKKFETESSKAKAELVEKVDNYLNYVVNEWMKENELAIEKGIKGEIAEDFINGLKKLFEDHYIDVPDEKYDVLEDQASKIEELEKKLNEEIGKNVELNKKSNMLERADILADVASDLAETSKEKFAKLAEEIEYSNAKDYQKKLETVKESYFGKKVETKENLDDVAADGSVNPDLSNSMAAYSAAISKTKDIKLSIK